MWWTVSMTAEGTISDDMASLLMLHYRSPRDLTTHEVRNPGLLWEPGQFTIQFATEAESVSSAWIRLLIIVNRISAAAGLPPYPATAITVKLAEY